MQEKPPCTYDSFGPKYSLIPTAMTNDAWCTGDKVAGARDEMLDWEDGHLGANHYALFVVG